MFRLPSCPTKPHHKAVAPSTGGRTKPPHCGTFPAHTMRLEVKQLAEEGFSLVFVTVLFMAIFVSMLVAMMPAVVTLLRLVAKP